MSTDRPLVHRDGISLVFALLAGSGGVCPKCGYGTRVTSKKWAACKREGCDGRAPRRPMKEVAAELKAAIESERTASHQSEP